MRLTRILATALAVVLTLTLAVSLVGAADATTAAHKPRHSFKVTAKEIDSANKFVLFGKVPTYGKRTVIVTRNVGGGRFRQLKKIETSKSGRFRTRIFQVDGKLTCFKVIVPKTADNRRTTSRGSSCIKS